MRDIWGDLCWTIDVCRHEVLDSSWRTENFARHVRIVPYCRLYMPLSGEAYLEHSGLNFHLRPGSLFLVPPLVSSHVSCPERMEMYWVNFNAFIQNSTLDIFSVVHTQYELSVQDEVLSRKLYESIIPHYQIGIRAGMPISMSAEFASRAALMLLVHPFLEKSGQHGKQSFERQSKFFGLLQYIEKNVDHNFTLKELAMQFHLNPTYLTNLFADCMGISLVRYCNTRKLGYALVLLSTTSQSISEIAYSLGFDDINNFSRLFKRHYGISPRNFRLNNKPGLLAELYLAGH